MAQPTVASTRCAPAWPKDALRIGFGVIWLIDAVLKWLPGFRASYMSTIMGIADGQPGWLQPWFHFWIRLQHSQATFFAYLVAGIETLIAVALITGFARKLTYSAAIVFSLLIWATAEGFGGPYTSGASDIGTAIIYAVVFAGLLALSFYAGPARFSADYYLEKRVTWWWRVAETRRPAPQAPVPDETPAGLTFAAAADTAPADTAPADTAPADTSARHQLNV
jgi:nitrite reductase (NO-forming)